MKYFYHCPAVHLLCCVSILFSWSPSSPSMHILFCIKLFWGFFMYFSFLPQAHTMNSCVIIFYLRSQKLSFAVLIYTFICFLAVMRVLGVLLNFCLFVFTTCLVNPFNLEFHFFVNIPAHWLKLLLLLFLLVYVVIVIIYCFNWWGIIKRQESVHLKAPAFLCKIKKQKLRNFLFFFFFWDYWLLLRDRSVLWTGQN